MDSYIKGSIREVFYKTDKGFMVGVFKIRETNCEELNDYLNKNSLRISTTRKIHLLYRKNILLFLLSVQVKTALLQLLLVSF